MHSVITAHCIAATAFILISRWLASTWWTVPGFPVCQPCPPESASDVLAGTGAFPGGGGCFATAPSRVTFTLTTCGLLSIVRGVPSGTTGLEERMKCLLLALPLFAAACSSEYSGYSTGQYGGYPTYSPRYAYSEGYYQRPQPYYGGENCGTPDEPKGCPPLPSHPLPYYPGDRY